MDILFFLLVGWSITSILVNGSIFDPLRTYLIVRNPFFSKLLTCMQCSGFWVGVGVGSLSTFGIIYHPMSNLFYDDLGWISNLLSIIAYGFLISGISVLFNAIMIYLLTKNNSDQSKQS